MGGKPRRDPKAPKATGKPETRATTEGSAEKDPVRNEESLGGVNSSLSALTPFQCMQQLLATRAADAERCVPALNTVEGSNLPSIGCVYSTN
jgi:hypothetical protein